MSQESDNDMEYDPSDVEFTAWLDLKKFNYKTMDHYTKRVLWIYWLRGDDKVELNDKESYNSNHEGEVVGIFRIETNVFDFETPLCRTFKEFNYLLQIDPDVLTKDIEGFKTYEEYKDDWIYEWNKDVPWDYEWYKALEDGELKKEALRNKAIMERTLDDDDESSYERRKRWNVEVDDNFPRVTLMEIDTRDEPWFADFANYLVSDIIPKGMTYQQKKKFFSDLKRYFWEEPCLCKAFRTAYKTPTGTTPYKLVYGKSCHLPFEIKHRAYWALKKCNPDLIVAGEKQMFQLHELDEFRHQAYEILAYTRQEPKSGMTGNSK
nr:reverse transcriptase domain-containing protein [Tanacetum cinerariifolium]